MGTAFQSVVHDILRIAIVDPVRRYIMQGRRRQRRRFVPLAAQLERRRARARGGRESCHAW